MRPNEGFDDLVRPQGQAFDASGTIRMKDIEDNRGLGPRLSVSATDDERDPSTRSEHCRRLVDPSGLPEEGTVNPMLLRARNLIGHAHDDLPRSELIGRARESPFGLDFYDAAPKAQGRQKVAHRPDRRWMYDARHLAIRATEGERGELPRSCVGTRKDEGAFGKARLRFVADTDVGRRRLGPGAQQQEQARAEPTVHDARRRSHTGFFEGATYFTQANTKHEPHPQAEGTPESGDATDREPPEYRSEQCEKPIRHAPKRR